MDLRGKVVLITGASEGIGAACARVFTFHGARVALLARRRRALEKVAASCQAGSPVLVISGDVTLAEDRRRAIEAVLERYGRLDVLINNAGAGLYEPACSAPDSHTRALWELNFFAPLALAQLALVPMRAQGGGTIVNVSSVASKVTLPWLTLYSASKSALGALSEGLRMELRGEGIHVIEVCPGYVATAFQQHILGGEVPSTVRAGKWLRITAEQCAHAIATGVERGSRTVVTPFSGWWIIWLARLLPGVLESRLARILERG